MIDTIFLDMDGVLCNFTQGILTRLGIDEIDGRPAWHYQTKYSSLNEVLQHTDHEPMSFNKVWKLIDGWGADFWSNLTWTDYGPELIQTCRDNCDNVVIMTSPSHRGSSLDGKLRWIQKNLPKDMHRMFAMTPQKPTFARPGALLIDDSTKHIEGFWDNGGSVYLWPRPWNTEGWDELDPIAELKELLNATPNESPATTV